jgi:hypothetical protein
VPAAAVIPAPRVYIRFVVVKKLVVETRSKTIWWAERRVGVGEQSSAAARICSFTVALLTKYRPAMVFTSVYFEKIRVFKTRNCSRRPRQQWRRRLADGNALTF